LTFSILAHDPRTHVVGIAIASRFFAVGAICPFVFPGVGAIVTQALGHPPFGAAAEALLRRNLTADEVIERLLVNDPNREARQLHLLDAQGRFAAFTGSACLAEAGDRQSGTVSVAGNMLASAEVLPAAMAGFAAGGGLAARLLAALAAAHAAGGDQRGQQAAALLIYGSQPFPLLSLRVDDDPDAVARLVALADAASADYLPYMRRFFPADECQAVFG
jgi:uncharacterized Ntn-hydrolase superfamily protein